MLTSHTTKRREIPRHLAVARDRSDDLTDSSLDDGSPRNQAKLQTVVQHRESAARQENGPPVNAGDGDPIYNWPIGQPALSLNFGSRAFNFADSQGREKIWCDDGPPSAALGQALSDEKFFSVGERRAHLGAEARRREVIALVQQ